MTLFILPCGAAMVLQAGLARNPGRGIHRGKIKTDGAPATLAHA